MIPSPWPFFLQGVKGEVPQLWQSQFCQRDTTRPPPSWLFPPASGACSLQPGWWLAHSCANENKNWLHRIFPKLLLRLPWRWRHTALVADVLKLLLRTSDSNASHFTSFMRNKMCTSLILSEGRYNEASPGRITHLKSDGHSSTCK